MSTSKDKETKSIKGAVTGRISAQNPNISQNLPRSRSEMLQRSAKAYTRRGNCVIVNSSAVEKQVGDIVYLNHNSIYTASPGNPKMGSEFECSGVVTNSAQFEVGHRIFVKWDTGRTNTYRTTDLLLSEDQKKAKDPNYLFSIKNRRRRN